MKASPLFFLDLSMGDSQAKSAGKSAFQSARGAREQPSMSR
jgi:hypothetical protein